MQSARINFKLLGTLISCHGSLCRRQSYRASTNGAWRTQLVVWIISRSMLLGARIRLGAILSQFSATFAKKIYGRPPQNSTRQDADMAVVQSVANSMSSVAMRSTSSAIMKTLSVWIPKHIHSLGPSSLWVLSSISTITHQFWVLLNPTWSFLWKDLQTSETHTKSTNRSRRSSLILRVM